MSTTTTEEFTAEEAQVELDATTEIYRELKGDFERFDYALAVLHKRRADKALGYKPWRAFVDENFPSIKVRRSYQILNHIDKVDEIEKLTGQESGLTEGQTRRVPAAMVPDLAKLALKKIEGGTEPLLAHKEATEETVAQAQKAKERDADTSSARNAATDDAASADQPSSTGEETETPEGEETETPEGEETEESSEEAAALQEASESLASDIQSIDKPVPYSAPRVFDGEQVNEAWIAEAADFLRGCPNRATFNALKVEIEQTYEIIDADLAHQVRKSA